MLVANNWISSDHICFNLLLKNKCKLCCLRFLQNSVDLGPLGNYPGSPFLHSDSDILLDSPDNEDLGIDILFYFYNRLAVSLMLISKVKWFNLLWNFIFYGSVEEFFVDSVPGPGPQSDEEKLWDKFWSVPSEKTRNNTPERGKEWHVFPSTFHFGDGQKTWWSITFTYLFTDVNKNLMVIFVLNSMPILLFYLEM